MFYVWRIAFFDNNGIYLLNTLHLTRLLLYDVPITLFDYLNLILKLLNPKKSWVTVPENKEKKMQISCERPLYFIFLFYLCSKITDKVMIDWGTSTEPSITMSYPTEAKQLVVDEAAAVGILQHLDKNELQNLLDDSDKLDSLIQDLQQVNNCFSCGVTCRCCKLLLITYICKKYLCLWC